MLQIDQLNYIQHVYKYLEHTEQHETWDMLCKLSYSYSELSFDPRSKHVDQWWKS